MRIWNQAISAEEIWNKSVLKGKQVIETVQNSKKAQIAVGLVLIVFVLRALLKKDKQIASDVSNRKDDRVDDTNAAHANGAREQSKAQNEHSPASVTGSNEARENLSIKHDIQDAPKEKSGDSASVQQYPKADAPDEPCNAQSERRAEDADEAGLEEALNLVSGANGGSRFRSEPTVSYSGATEALHDSDSTGLNYPSENVLKREADDAANKDVAYEQLRLLEEA